MGIQYDLNALEIWLEKDDPNEPKELKDEVYKQLEYLQKQSRSLHTNNRRILLLETVKSIIKLYNEYPIMIDGRNNTNDQPF